MAVAIFVAGVLGGRYSPEELLEAESLEEPIEQGQGAQAIGVRGFPVGLGRPRRGGVRV